MTDSRANAVRSLMLRVSLGTMFIAHALLKYFVFTLPGTAQFFESLGLPGALGYATFAAELIGGVLLDRSACRHASSRWRSCRCCSARRGRMPPTAGSSRRPRAAGNTPRSGPWRWSCRRSWAMAHTRCGPGFRCAVHATRVTSPGPIAVSTCQERKDHEALLLARRVLARAAYRARGSRPPLHDRSAST